MQEQAGDMVSAQFIDVWGLERQKESQHCPAGNDYPIFKKKIEALYLRKNQIKWFGVQKNENMS